MSLLYDTKIVQRAETGKMDTDNSSVMLYGIYLFHNDHFYFDDYMIKNVLYIVGMLRRYRTAYCWQSEVVKKYGKETCAFQRDNRRETPEYE